MIVKNIQERIDFITNSIGNPKNLVIKHILIGNTVYYNAAVVYMDTLVEKNLIDEHILTPLMLKVDIELPKLHLLDFLCKKYITLGNTDFKEDLAGAIDELNQGKTIIFVDGYTEYITIKTNGGKYRSITDAENEVSLKGTREGFVENIETNITMIKRILKDKNLRVDIMTVGKRTKSDVGILYIEDIVDEKLLIDIKERIGLISVDGITSTGELEQYIEWSPSSPFPQVFGTEKPSKVVSKLLEGRVAIIVSGAPYVITAPAVFIEFFQAVEDYYERTVVSSFTRLCRWMAAFIVVFLSPIYLVMISYNVELIPIMFVNPIAQSRKGIPLTPFLEILFMELTVELLREGGLRLPPKIAQTLSIVGGIIIGNAVIDAKVVSPSTLLIVGIVTVSSFLIPNYEMAIVLRFLRFPMLILADAAGFLGIAAGGYILAYHLFSLKSFGVPYLTFTISDMKDIFTRSPLWKMNMRPEAIPNKNSVRQQDFRRNFKRGRKNE
ncbi:spore germination protein [Clostridium thermarum]|uniref:spore germination protein n=1 Tax=Clostridium thermarum TaxID=1716543 RepID=UPI0013D1736C|nr:spore germination protein [Clostridium thermarum]